MSEDLLIFSLGGRERYALSIAQAREIVKLEFLNQVPGSSSQLLGLARVRDAYIPVIDTKAVLFREPCTTQSSMAVILDLGEPMALAVHEVSQVMKWVRPADKLPTPRGKFVEDIIHDEHGIIQKLRPAEIVGAFRIRDMSLAEEGIQDAA